MANELKTGQESSFVPFKHGAAGHVRVGCDVRPDVKDDLVFIAKNENRTLKSVTSEAFELYLRTKGMR